MNPQTIIQQIMNSNPMFNANPILKNAIQMAQTNNVNGLKEIAENLCKSKGVNLEDVQNQVMQQFGIK